MDSVGLLERAQALGLRVWVDGEHLRVRGHKAHIAVVEELLDRKAELFPLLTSSPAIAAGPAACTHAQTYRRASGVAVCLGCGWTFAPGALEWQAQVIHDCAESEHVACQPSASDGGMRQCKRCSHVWKVPAPAGVLHLWSTRLHDDIYGTDSLAQARELLGAHRIAVYTPAELRRLRHLQRTDPETFTDKLVVIHRFKREFGCHVDEVIIPQLTEQES